jgi:hypothetical protein
MGRLLPRVCGVLPAVWLFACGSDSAAPPSGSDSAAPPSGYDSAAPSSGYDSAVSPSGYDSAAPSSGYDSAVSPSGYDSGNAVGGSDFSASACKKELKKGLSTSSTPAHLRALKVIQDESGLAGLRCVAWQRLANGLKVDLYNFDAACGAKWTGDGAVASDGTLALNISNPSCSLTACGVCLYDWSFDLRTSAPTGASLPVTIAVLPCEKMVSGTSITMAGATWAEVLGDQDQGIHCVFADYTALILQAGVTGTRGTSGMPCAGATQTCSEGLVCDAGAAATESLCLVPCAADADCPRTEVWSCQSGLCRPRP